MIIKQIHPLSMHATASTGRTSKTDLELPPLTETLIKSLKKKSTVLASAITELEKGLKDNNTDQIKAGFTSVTNALDELLVSETKSPSKVLVRDNSKTKISTLTAISTLNKTLEASQQIFAQSGLATGDGPKQQIRGIVVSLLQGDLANAKQQALSQPTLIRNNISRLLNQFKDASQTSLVEATSSKSHRINQTATSGSLYGRGNRKNLEW
ncbi:MAG: hypothetical protein SFU25_03725 [Candidatus Caenarcaniphilales bacterium]|nr:hypothetical protein [Candidatus Caenarcaniphilales bacterium]